MKADHLLIWMDLEMTGLNPETDRIIEMATLITDGRLEIVAEGPEIVVHQPDECLDSMDDWNRTHHGESGLTARVKRSTVGEDEAARLTLDFIAEHCAPRTAPLAGNSIHQDRRFLVRYMPRLEEHLHYRNVDVSTIKELVRRWYPETLEQAPPKNRCHRALDDIRESIEELRFYRDSVFR